VQPDPRQTPQPQPQREHGDHASASRSLPSYADVTHPQANKGEMVRYLLMTWSENRFVRHVLASLRGVRRIRAALSLARRTGSARV
jgi:hypothetical protein